jgi:hypothetical protein
MKLLGAGEAPAIGIIGVFVGIVTGLLAGGIVSVYADRLSGKTASALVAYATFGVAALAIAGTRYVNVPYADEVFTLPVHIGVAVVVAVIVALLTIQRGVGKHTATA